MLANLERLCQRMDELALDGLVATTRPNVFYLTGITSLSQSLLGHEGHCYAVVSRDRPAHPHFVSSRGELDQALDALPPLAGTIGFGDFYREAPPGVRLTSDEERLRHAESSTPPAPTPPDALATALRTAGLATARVGIDEHGLPQPFRGRLVEALPAADLEPAAHVFAWARKVKTAEEIRRLTGAAAVTEHAIRAATAIVGLGVTEQDLVREFERAVVSAGARPQFTLVKFGRAGVHGQTLPGTTPLRRGDAIWFDVGCQHDGYWSDMARVFSWGEPSPQLVRYHAAMLAGQDRALREARDGMSGDEVFHLTVDAVRAAGVRHYRRQNVGHGIGAALYDRVILAPGNDDRLEDGTVVNIETPYHEYGFGAVQVEDPFVMTPAGNRLLTTLDRGLTVL